VEAPEVHAKAVHTIIMHAHALHTHAMHSSYVEGDNEVHMLEYDTCWGDPTSHLHEQNQSINQKEPARLVPLNYCNALVRLIRNNNMGILIVPHVKNNTAVIFKCFNWAAGLKI
jgi:hypothetical protein